MNLTLPQITTIAECLCGVLFAALSDHPVVQCSLLSAAPVKLRIAVQITDAPQSVVMDILRDGTAFSAAWRDLWPLNFNGGRHSNSIAQDGDAVAFDVTFYDVKLTAQPFADDA